MYPNLLQNRQKWLKSKSLNLFLHRIALSILFGTLFFIPTFSQHPPFLSAYNQKWVDSVFSTMTLDDKIGQLFMPRGNYSGKAHNVDTLKKWVIDYKIGGIVFFASNPTTQVKITNELQALSKHPLMIGQDFEWGLGMRLDSTDRFPYALALGAIQGNEDLIEKMGREIAIQCKRIGVHINYAPVVDINNNPKNPVINFRSFGSDKYNVTAKGLAYMKGMQSQNLLCTAKHFPGHGDTDTDSHHALPLILHDKKRLSEVELYPFTKLIEAGLSGMMTAHLNIPALEKNRNLASTFSYDIISTLLKKELKFAGLTFTDAMDMQGAVQNFPKGEAMVQAILAGNDIVETFTNLPEAFFALKNAVIKGRIPVETLDAKVKKILKAKSWLGLDKWQPVLLNSLVEDLNSVEADQLNQRLTEKSITCVKNEANLLPIKNLNQKIAVLTVEGDSMSLFYQMLSNYARLDHFVIPKNASFVFIDTILSKLKAYDIAIVSIHLSDIRAGKKYGLNESNKRILTEISTYDNVIFNLLGNPLILGQIEALKNCKTILLGYQLNKYTESITAQMIFGALSPQGKLPLYINEFFYQGMGLTWPHIDRLSYGSPELVGIDRNVLEKGIDSIVYLGLKEKAFPGAVVQVAKNGKVIFSKPYGYQTYAQVTPTNMTNGDAVFQGFKPLDDAMDNISPLDLQQQTKSKDADNEYKITLNHRYDLASLTKILASNLWIMQQLSLGSISLDSFMSRYVPNLMHSNKEKMTLKALLAHQAGLQDWIPFWKNAVDTVETLKKALALNPELERACVFTEVKPGFFKRLFGAKTKRYIDYMASVKADGGLWKKALTPQTRTWKSHIFSNQKSDEYSVEVTSTLYLHKNYIDTIFEQIIASPVTKEPSYVYSDLHYYFYPSFIKNVTGKTFEEYLSNIYGSIGANSLMFHPLNAISKSLLVPTEYDSLFRQGLIHGHVHDEGAAMLGGISGHAGLFGNANDVTKIMQLFLQKGSYGGVSYIKPEVVDTCTTFQYKNNRRGIGFDKKDLSTTVKNAPSLCSEESYGHSGYTGTYTWVDPKHQLVYVFLSNRVYPSRENKKINTLSTRQAIGDHIIKTILNTPHAP